jgi:hypothetical protein
VVNEHHSQEGEDIVTKQRRANLFQKCSNERGAYKIRRDQKLSHFRYYKHENL